jgi:hypothetical protein
MSLGWRYCLRCCRYRKWQEAPPRDWLDCWPNQDHDPHADTDIVNFTVYTNDDDFDYDMAQILQIPMIVRCKQCTGHGCTLCSWRGTEAIPLTELYSEKRLNKEYWK